MASSREKAWSEEEDRILRELVVEHGEKRWKAIGIDFKKHFPDTRRSSIYCRQRYMNHLRSGLIKGPLTPQEVERIFDLHRSYANRWALIAEHVPGRTQNTIKVFFYSALKKAKDAFNRQQGQSKKCTRTIRSLVRDTTTTRFLNMGPSLNDAETNEEEVRAEESGTRENEEELWRRWAWWWNFYLFLNSYFYNFYLY